MARICSTSPPGSNLSTGYPGGTAGAPGLLHDYRTTFVLAGLDPTTASITGRVVADDSVEIFLNGVDKGGFGVPAYTGFNPFAITSSFVSGLNTLDFMIFNFDNGPTTLRVDSLAGTADAIITPEPATIASMVLGLAAAGVVRYRRRAATRA